jgi:hypothetical protein
MLPTGDGKMDAETVSLLALKHPNVELQTKSRVTKLETAGWQSIETVHYLHNGERKRVSPKLVILSAGAINPPCCCCARRRIRKGLANSLRSGRPELHEPQFSAMLAISPFRRNTSIYQKTFGFNDYYLTDGEGWLAARQCPAARQDLRRHPEGQHARVTGMAAVLDLMAGMRSTST